MPQTIEIPVSDDVLRRLDERARQSGLKREEYVCHLLSRDLNGPQTLSQVLAPYRAQVAASGISDEALMQLFSDAREELHREQHP